MEKQQKETTLKIEIVSDNPIGNGYFYAALNLPAAEYEIRDAMQRARMVNRVNAYEDVSVLECPLLPDLVFYRLDSPTIDELNFFAKRLAGMDDAERAVFRTVAPKQLGSPSDDLLSMKDLINCTYGLENVTVAANVTNDEQLGAFVIENELHEDVSAIPESSLYLLDKAAIGRLQREADGGVFADGYYIVTVDYERPEIYDGKTLPETETEDWFAFKLLVAPAPQEDVSEVEDKAVWLTLPMRKKEADRIAKELGMGKIEDCVYLDFISSFPQITDEQFGDMKNFDKLNVLAEKLLYLSPADQMKFKAVLTAETPVDIESIVDILENLHKYELAAFADSDGDFFKEYLMRHLDARFDEKWLDTLLVKTEGARLLDRLGAVNTEYGVISARGRTLYELVPYDKEPEKELKTQSLTDEKLEVVEVLGQTALFTNGRVTEQELPDGLYKYDLREGENISFSSIERAVGVNHGGTILVKAPLDFGGEEYFVFDDDTTPNFLGYELTPREFMESNFTQSEGEDMDETEEIQMGGMTQ